MHRRRTADGALKSKHVEPIARQSGHHEEMPTATVKPKTYKLRGYVKERPDGKYIGVCLRPNLVVEAESQNAALNKCKQAGSNRAEFYGATPGTAAKIR